MDTGIRYGLLIMGLAAMSGLMVEEGGVRPPGVPADTLPTGVTPATIKQGKGLFGSQGLCLACHGADGRGQIGPNLTDTTWLHGRGTYPEIVARIKSGVPAAESKTGQIMPPRGGSSLSDDQVRAVAAYVWSLSRPGFAKGQGAER